MSKRNYCNLFSFLNQYLAAFLLTYYTC